jgi:hypothetical protein
MRAALQYYSAPRRQSALVKTVAAPIGGWNARDTLAHMDPLDAVVLDNWYPTPTAVEIRGGYVSHATGTTGNVKTLAVYNKLNGTHEMFALTASGVYDVSSSGAVGSSKAARANGKHQWTVFGDGTDLWLILCNGVDKPLYYDGTTWTAVDGSSSPALTGVTTTNIISVGSSKGRLFFILKDDLAFYYLPAGSAGGALTKFDLTGQTKRGGFLLTMATWTKDAGDGIDDFVVFITSEGEAVVYQGADPATAADWLKVGTFFIGKPLGRRCTQQVGGDVIVVTENGTFGIAEALQSAAVNYKLALSYKIEPHFTATARQYGTVFGWEVTNFPARDALIVNIPNVEDGIHEQFVMNTITKSWCRFTDWDAECFAVFNKELYFGTGTTVVKAWEGKKDGSDDIVAYAKQAFNYFGNTGVLKKFNLFRPIFSANGTMQYLVGFDVDFEDVPLSGVATYAVINGAKWDVDRWDVGRWQAGQTISKAWNSPAVWEGYCLAWKVKITTSNFDISWMASEISYQKGGILG